MSDKSKSTDEEREAMRECIADAFWYRSLPMGLTSGSLAIWAVKTGRIKYKSRFGAWPIVLGFGSMGYIIGKISYILSDSCMNVFLEKAPESSISESIRQRREDDWNVDGQLPNRFMDILDQIDEDDMSDTEHKILEDCNTIAYYRYSLPLSIALGSSMYLSVKAKILKESRFITTFPKLPKTIIGSIVGYMIGQYMYVNSADCPRRFQKYDHDGRIARLLRGENDYVYDGSADLEHKEDSTQEYVLPTEDVATDLSIEIRDSWTNSLNRLFRPV